MGLTAIVSGVLVFLVLAVIGALLQAEAVGATFALTRQLLALAIRRLPAEYRSEYRAEWHGELHALKGRPITALSFALWVLATVGRTARDLPSTRVQLDEATEEAVEIQRPTQQPTVTPDARPVIDLRDLSLLGKRSGRRFAPYPGESDRDAIVATALAFSRSIPQAPSVLDVKSPPGDVADEGGTDDLLPRPPQRMRPPQQPDSAPPEIMP